MFNMFNKENGVTIGGYTVCMYKTTQGDGADFLCIFGRYNKYLVDTKTVSGISIVSEIVQIQGLGLSITLACKTNKEAVALGELLCKTLFFDRSGTQTTVCDLQKLDSLMNAEEKK